MMRTLAVVATWIIATAVLAPVCFLVVIVLAGPHAGLLPAVLESATAVLCLAILLIVPVWLAVKVARWWR
jgi:hypothetical protein